MDPVIGFREADLKGIKTERDDVSITLTASTDVEAAFLTNAVRFLKEMEGTPFVPILFAHDDRRLVLGNLGDSEPVTDEVIFRRACALLLRALHEKRIRHGDLTQKNIIVKGNIPIVIDWNQSKYDWMSGPDKRPEGDAFHLWRAAVELSPDTSRHLRRWVAIRNHLGNTLLDLGCAEGDFCLFALSESREKIVAVDHNLEVLNTAQEICSDIECYHGDIVEWVDFSFDTVLLLSTWPYIVQKYGRDSAEDLLDRICKEAGQLIFETQLAGDGPGPDFFQTDEDVFNLLGRFGSVDLLCRLFVHGRDATRSVWKVVP